MPTLCRCTCVAHEEPAWRSAGAPSDSEAAKELVAQRLGLGDGAQPAVVHLLRVQLHAAVRELEPLLHDAGQLPDAAPLLACGKAVYGGSDVHQRGQSCLTGLMSRLVMQLVLLLSHLRLQSAASRGYTAGGKARLPGMGWGRTGWVGSPSELT